MNRTHSFGDPTKRLGGLRVHIVDDSLDNLLVARVLLENAGALVSDSRNGAEAVGAVKRAMEADRTFDLVLMDLVMPVMDGYEATRELRTEGYDRRIVALTALTGDEARKDCLAAGCDSYLAKPILPEVFYETLTNVVYPVDGPDVGSCGPTELIDLAWLVTEVDRARSIHDHDELLALTEVIARSTGSSGLERISREAHACNAALTAGVSVLGASRLLDSMIRTIRGTNDTESKC